MKSLGGLTDISGLLSKPSASAHGATESGRASSSDAMTAPYSTSGSAPSLIPRPMATHPSSTSSSSHPRSTETISSTQSTSVRARCTDHTNIVVQSGSAPISSLSTLSPIRTVPGVSRHHQRSNTGGNTNAAPSVSLRNEEAKTPSNVYSSTRPLATSSVETPILSSSPINGAPRDPTSTSAGNPRPFLDPIYANDPNFMSLVAALSKQYVNPGDSQSRGDGSKVSARRRSAKGKRPSRPRVQKPKAASSSKKNSKKRKRGRKDSENEADNESNESDDETSAADSSEQSCICATCGSKWKGNQETEEWVQCCTTQCATWYHKRCAILHKAIDSEWTCSICEQCPVCEQAWKENDEYIQCSGCHRGVHDECAPADGMCTLCGTPGPV